MVYGAVRMIDRVRSSNELPTSDMEVNEVSAFPEDIDALTTTFGKQFGFMVIRTEKYLKWRFGEPVGGLKRIFVARRNDRTTGYAVISFHSIDKNKFMNVIDLVAMPNDRPSIDLLLRSLIKIAKEEKITMIQIWIPKDHPFLQALRNAGFNVTKHDPNARVIRPMLRFINSEASVENIITHKPYQYHIMMGDTDWI